MSVPLPQVKILTRNCIDKYSTITASHGGDTSKLYDRDKSITYKTSGAKRDPITASIEVIFKVGTVETAFMINSVFLLNTNVKNYVFQIWNGSAYEEVCSGEVPTGVTYACAEFPQVSTSRVKLLMRGTQNRYNQEKELGQMIVTRLRHVLSTGATDYKLNFSQKASMMEPADGGLQIAYTRAPGSRLMRYGATAVFTLLPSVDFDFLLCLKDEGEPFLWYPEGLDRPDELWYVHWVNPPDYFYTDYNKNAGYTFSMELREV